VSRAVLIALGIVLCAIAVQRLLVAVAMPVGLPVPVLLFLFVLAEGVSALVAGIGLLLRRRFARVALLVFATAAVVHMLVDVVFYGVRSLLEGLAWALLAVLLAAAGWVALAWREAPVDQPGGRAPAPLG
jgi:hypothetical protein